MYQPIVGWASASVAAGELLHFLKFLTDRSIDPFRQMAL